MNENNNLKSTNTKGLIIILILGFLLVCILGYNYYTKYDIPGDLSKNNVETVSLDVKEKPITKEDYLKDKGVTDFTEDYQDKKKEYFEEISTAPSKRESYLYLGQQENVLFYQTVHSERKYNEMKESFKNLTSEELKEVSNKIKLTTFQSKKLELLGLSVFDTFILEYQVDYSTKERKVTNLYKGKDYSYHFKEIKKEELSQVLPDGKYIGLIGLFERKFLKSDLIGLVNKISTKDRCNLSVDNEVKKFIHESSYLELFKQESCDNIVIGYFETESGEKLIDRVYVDSFYTGEEKKIYLENYKTAGIETMGDDTIMTKLYYELNKKYPLVFY